MFRQTTVCRLNSHPFCFREFLLRLSTACIKLVYQHTEPESNTRMFRCRCIYCQCLVVLSVYVCVCVCVYWEWSYRRTRMHLRMNVCVCVHMIWFSWTAPSMKQLQQLNIPVSDGKVELNLVYRTCIRPLWYDILPHRLCTAFNPKKDDFSPISR